MIPIPTDYPIFVVPVQERLSPALSTSKTIQIIVEAINDGPYIMGPLDMEAEEDTPTAVNGITVHDPDCDDVPRGVLEIAITASNGTVQLLGSVAGLYLMEALPGSLKIRGKTGPVNVALAGLSYVGATDFSGRDAIVVTADDLGNSGTGGALSASWSTEVLVSAVNDPPVILPPTELDMVAGGVLFVLEDEASPMGTFGVADVDDLFLRVTVSAQVGSVRTDGINKEIMLVVTSSDEAHTATGSRITFEGTSDEVSAALGNLTYTSSLNWNSLASESRDVVEVSRVWKFQCKVFCRSILVWSLEEESGNKTRRVTTHLNYIKISSGGPMYITRTYPWSCSQMCNDNSAE